MALARRNIAAGGAPSAPSSVVPRNCLSDSWGSWKAVCSPTPRWGLMVAEDMWNPAMTTLMSTGHCSEGFLPAVKYAKPFDCPQKTWRPCRTFRLSHSQSILLIPKTTSVLYDPDCSTRLSHSFCHCLFIFSFALFLEMWACALPALPFSP